MRSLLMAKRDDEIVAVALLTRDDVSSLGDSLKKVFRIDQSADFASLLKALDDAEREKSVTDNHY